MQVADEQSYQEVIQALKAYMSTVYEASGEISRAGTDCVDNTRNDPAAAVSNQRLQEALGRINSAVQDIDGIITDLQQELEEAIEAAASANVGE